MFEDLFGQNVVFSWDDDVLWKFVITVKRNYRDVVYHNFTHAFKVGDQWTQGADFLGSGPDRGRSPVE